MMKSLEEVIKGLELCHDRAGCSGKNCPYEDDNDYTKQVNCFDVLEVDLLHYLQQLKSITDNPPMTWEELKEIAQDEENWKREPVWLELYEIDGVCFEPRWAILNDWMDMCYEPDYKNDGECIECLTAYTNTIIFKEDIGVLWNAYRRKPDHFADVGKKEAE